MEHSAHKDLLKLIDSVRERIKDSSVIIELCEKYDVDVNYIDLIPMAFADIDVSARTDKGCLYFNYRLLDDGDFERDDHYMVHEIVHHFQQCFGDGPTEGSNNSEEYLDNELEQAGFQAQTEYLSEEYGTGMAEQYVDKVLDHHDVDGPDRKKRKKELLELAHLVSKVKTGVK
jgi:hypothetical protein